MLWVFHVSSSYPQVDAAKRALDGDLPLTLQRCPPLGTEQVDMYSILHEIRLLMPPVNNAFILLLIHLFIVTLGRWSACSKWLGSVSFSEPIHRALLQSIKVTLARCVHSIHREKANEWTTGFLGGWASWFWKSLSILFIALFQTTYRQTNWALHVSTGRLRKTFRLCFGLHSGWVNIVLNCREKSVRPSRNAFDNVVTAFLDRPLDWFASLYQFNSFWSLLHRLTPSPS